MAVALLFNGRRPLLLDQRPVGLVQLQTFHASVFWVVSPVTYGGAVRTFLGAKRLECAELAPAFRVPTLNDSASKLDALQTLRATGMPVLSNLTVFTTAHIKP